MAFDASKVHHIGIYPPMGLARVGNSTATEEGEGWYVGPEVPGRDDTPPGGFKDKNFGVKRQAARFRVYAFDEAGSVLCEATPDKGFKTEWKVQVANRKASWYAFMGKHEPGAFQPGSSTLRNPNVQSEEHPDNRTRLIVTHPIVTLSGVSSDVVPLQGHFQPEHGEDDVYLGEVHVDDAGRLVVKPGRGDSRSVAVPGLKYPLIMTDFDNPDWIDDTSDGWIDASVEIEGKTFTAPSRARVISTTPKFAHGFGMDAPTTLYDLIEDIYEQPKRAAQGDAYKVPSPGWYEHIWPLLRRPVVLAWVNGQANGGHGIGGPGHFLDEKWQKALRDKTPEGETTRKNVLGRMRLPETPGGKYDTARQGQGFPYFMPWFSGDNGRTTYGEISTFSAVTELQYDRLVAWAKGDYIIEDNPLPPPVEHFDLIPLQDQPHALTRASLEPTIGAPLFPGLELSWNAELPSTYDLDRPFATVAANVKEGDLTKYLSLPWQSDFYMCRNYWWPSARPDAVVSEKAWEDARQSVSPIDLPSELKKRVPWERGLHQNYTDTYRGQPLFANTDMARRWHELGFIVEEPWPEASPEPIFVERQRNFGKGKSSYSWTGRSHPVEDESESAGKADPTHGGGISLPAPDSDKEPIKDVASLQKHLRIAMGVELSTIPVYLAALYSIKPPAAQANNPRYYDPIAGAIRNVVSEEMLHLTLAGNILKAVGGEFKVYDPKYIPKYPMEMPGRVPPLDLKLASLTDAQLYVFTEIELPAKPDAQPEVDHYHTLGQFYSAIQRGLTYLDGKHDDLFRPDTAPFQFAPGGGYQPKIRDAGGSVVVTDLASAQEAIKIIVEQGEGEVKDPEKEKAEKDHYEIFVELRKGLEDGSTEWEVYPTISYPTALDYKNKYNDPRLFEVALTFNATYCFLLMTIDKLWELRSDDSRRQLVNNNLYGIMLGVLKPLAQFFVQQPVGNKGKVAAPTFQYYPFRDGESALTQLQTQFQKAVDAYINVPHPEEAENPLQVPVDNYGPQIEQLLPIQDAVGNLLDLDSFERIAGASIGKKSTFVPNGAQSWGAKGFARGY